jgi:hypothetical protein
VINRMTALANLQRGFVRFAASVTRLGEILPFWRYFLALGALFS